LGISSIIWFLTYLLRMTNYDYLMSMYPAEGRERKRIAVNLDGEIVRKFEDIKEFLGIDTETEVVRHLITWYHSNVIKKGEL